MKWRILLDTNVLLRYARVDDSQYREVRSAVEKLTARGDELVILPQCIREAWVVLTRPKEINGYGLLPSEAGEYVRVLLRTFSFIDDEPGIFDEWISLVNAHGVGGRQGHDANLAAAARFHRLTHVLTLNDKDFARYALSGLQTLTPQELL